MSIIKLLINLTYYLFTGFLFSEIIIYGDKKCHDIKCDHSVELINTK